MTKILILYISVICLLHGGKLHHNDLQKDDPILNIDFQYNFKNDTIDLEINNVLIIHRMVINSFYIGFTDISVKVKSYHLHQFKIEYLDQKKNGHRSEKTKYCYRSKKIKIVMKLNDKSTYYLIDPNNGSWIGFGKGDSNSLELTQQKTSFYYE